MLIDSIFSTDDLANQAAIIGKMNFAINRLQEKIGELAKILTDRDRELTERKIAFDALTAQYKKHLARCKNGEVIEFPKPEAASPEQAEPLPEQAG